MFFIFCITARDGLSIAPLTATVDGMACVFELQRTRISGGTFRSPYLEQLCTGDGQCLYMGKAPTGYLSRDVVFTDADGRPSLTFGPNRAIAPNSHVLKQSDGRVLATFKHGLVQSVLGGSGFAVEDGDGRCILQLLPGETVAKSFPDRVSSWRSDQLAVIADDQIVGSADRRKHSDSDGLSAEGILHRLAELPVAIFRQVTNSDINEPARTVARYEALVPAGHLTPAIVLGVLMFKLHRHDQRGIS